MLKFIYRYIMNNLNNLILKEYIFVSKVLILNNRIK